jgi:HAD superfamily 5'-nucleotidase-like hydrolase
MSLFVNRLLNMKNIKVIGFDMDYTLVRYHSDLFEELTHSLALKKLVSSYGYPKEINQLPFDFDRAIGGLVIDRRNGNVLKLSRFGKVKISYNGLDQIDFREQKELYQDLTIDLSDPHYKSLDTAFAISNGVLFSQLVQLKKDGVSLPDYHRLSEDIGDAINDIHQDDSIKSVVTSDFEKYVISDPQVAAMLERYKAFGKKLVIITNSDYKYTKKLLDYSLNPHLKKHKKWEEVFQVVVTFADKPSFFQRPSRFLKISNSSGAMENHFGPVDKGVYQGGWFGKLEQDLGVHGREILYFGDHIYGDIVSIKKQCGWRTALVLDDLEKEMESLEKAGELQDSIDRVMDRKSYLEKEINRMELQRFEGRKIDKKRLNEYFTESDELNLQVSRLLGEHKAFFNPYWGEVLRAGSDESRFADQVERYACIYMTRVSDLYNYSPKTYFRPQRRTLPHEERH